MQELAALNAITASPSRTSCRTRRRGCCAVVLIGSTPRDACADSCGLAVLRCAIARPGSRPLTPGKRAFWRRGRCARRRRSGREPRPAIAVQLWPGSVAGEDLFLHVGERALLVGGVALPGGRLPDLDVVVDADDHAVAL